MDFDAKQDVALKNLYTSLPPRYTSPADKNRIGTLHLDPADSDMLARAKQQLAATGHAYFRVSRLGGLGFDAEKTELIPTALVKVQIPKGTACESFQTEPRRHRFDPEMHRALAPATSAASPTPGTANG